MSGKRFIMVSISMLLIAAFLLLTGCPGSGIESGSYQGITGSIETGTPEEEATIPVGPDGTIIEFKRPGDPLNGLELKIPPGSYPDTRNFALSYARINSHSFGEAFNPVTPLITIDNGGSYSDEIMTVKVPVSVPEGHFAMGFIYDAKTRMLEGLPTVARDSTSITVATRHFSSFVISTISDALIKKDVDSGFRPGSNDWQFVNYGSYIAPNGHCTGQSMTAMWYFCTQPEGPNQPLYNRYDNNGNKPATPKFQYDDSLGYRFASVVWKESAWDSVSRKITEKYVSYSDEATWKMFAYSMQLTGEPQMTEIWDTKNGGGHAMVVYRITNGALFIADPNYPAKKDRSIEYSNGKFKPYNSGANADEIAQGKGKSYDRITYVAKTALSDWGKIAQHWQEFKKKTIGNDMFPEYKIVWWDKDNSEYYLTDGEIVNQSLIEVKSKPAPEGVFLVLYRDEQVLKPDSTGKYALNPGNNRIGILMAAPVKGSGNRYVDFRYFNIVSTSLKIEPESLVGKPGQEYNFKAVSGASTSGARYEWYLNGTLLKDKTSDSIACSFASAGKYTLSAKQLDSTGKELGTASAGITIEGASTSTGSIIAALQNMKSLEAQVGGKFTFKNWYGENWSSDEGRIPAEERIETGTGTFEIKPSKISWSGTSFNSKVEILDDPKNPIKYEISGTVSSDGKTLLTLNYSYEESGYSEPGKMDVFYAERTTRKIQLKNVPLAVEADTVTGSVTGSNVKDRVTSLDSQRLAYKDGKLIQTSVYMSTNWSATGADAPFIKVKFSK